MSLARLLTDVATAPADASAAADHLLDASLRDHEPDDDVALVVVGHRR